MLCSFVGVVVYGPCSLRASHNVRRLLTLDSTWSKLRAQLRHAELSVHCDLHPVDPLPPPNDKWYYCLNFQPWRQTLR